LVAPSGRDLRAIHDESHLARRVSHAEFARADSVVDYRCSGAIARCFDLIAGMSILEGAWLPCTERN